MKKAFFAGPALLLLLVLGSCTGIPGGGSGSALRTAFLLQKAFQDITEEVVPVVVQINVTETRVQQLPEGEEFPFSPWHYGPFDPDEDIPDQKEFYTQGIGSGVLVKRDGDRYYVLTNGHVIGDADEAEIKISEERYFDATIIGKDSRKDLAMISFTSEEELPIARLGDSDELKVGDWVLAVGSPYGYDSTVTSGIISAIGRRGPSNNINQFIQTDAAINQGNSGGALVNLKGEVIGINTWITTPTGGSIGLGFAIPVNNIKGAVDDFIEYGSIQYGWLGVSIAELLPGMEKEMMLEGQPGAFVYHVFLGSPADLGGIMPGDFITHIDKQPVLDSSQFVLTIGELKPDTETDFTVIRNGEKKTVTLALGLRSDNDTIASSGSSLWPGIGVLPVTDEIRREFALDPSQNGVITGEVEPKSVFQELGIRFGDLITEINDMPVKNIQDFYTIINTIKKEGITAEIVRNGSAVTVTND